MSMSGRRRATRRRFLAHAIGLYASASLAAGESIAADPPPSEPDGGRTSAPPERPRVRQPRLTLTPANISVSAGQSVEFIARASGGEAMLFSLGWSIREGPAGGTVNPERERREDGSQAAVYLAPAAAGGVFHVLVTLREFPAVQAEATVEVRPAR